MVTYEDIDKMSHLPRPVCNSAVPVPDYSRLQFEETTDGGGGGGGSREEGGAPWYVCRSESSYGYSTSSQGLTIQPYATIRNSQVSTSTPAIVPLLPPPNHHRHSPQSNTRPPQQPTNSLPPETGSRPAACVSSADNHERVPWIHETDYLTDEKYVAATAV